MLLPERHRELGGAWRSADRAQLNLGAAQGDVGVEEHRLECSPPLSSPLLSPPLLSSPLAWVCAWACARSPWQLNRISVLASLDAALHAALVVPVWASTAGTPWAHWLLAPRNGELKKFSQ